MSVWQMTSTERKNAATFIQFTTVRPFSFMGSSFKCFYCQQYQPDIPALLDHTSSHVVEDRATILNKYVPIHKRALQVDISNLKCKICNARSQNLSSIKKHLEQAHEKQFFGNSNGMTEYDMEAKNGVLVCHLCGKDFHSFSLLSSHMNCHVGKVVCESCGAGFLDLVKLRKHTETHLILRYNCKQCNREFFKKSQLKYHTEKIHKGKETKLTKCLYCSETFREHYGKMVHLKKAHGISKKFQCHLCSSTFGMRRNLTEHTTKCHTEKYKCVICSECFGIEFRLKQHMKRHTGEKDYACQICKNTYMHKITLAKHMKSHNSFSTNHSSSTSTSHNSSST